MSKDIADSEVRHDDALESPKPDKKSSSNNTKRPSKPSNKIMIFDKKEK